MNDGVCLFDCFCTCMFVLLFLLLTNKSEKRITVSVLKQDPNT